MKQIIAAVALLAFSTGYSADVAAQAGKAQATVKADGVTKKDGKIWITRGGKTSELKEKFVTANGHMFLPNGTVVFNTGSSIVLQEGEVVNMNGDKVVSKPMAEKKISPTTGK
jgi:hypothetical protein